MMTPRLNEIWVYLAASPLVGLTATLLAYVFAFRIYERSRFSPLANPVMIAVALLVTVLTVTGTPYKTYFDGAQFVHFLLGPATVALAVPLYLQLPKLRTHVFPLLVGWWQVRWWRWYRPSALHGCSAHRAKPCCRSRPSR